MSELARIGTAPMDNLTAIEKCIRYAANENEEAEAAAIELYQRETNLIEARRLAQEFRMSFLAALNKIHQMENHPGAFPGCAKCKEYFEEL